MQSILAAEIGYELKAQEYFRYALFMDLANVAGNVVDGVHIASTGGVWMALTHGFGGMRTYQGVLSFDPRVPSDWGGMRFSIRFNDSYLRIELNHERYRFTLDEGDEIDIRVCGTNYRVGPDAPLEVNSCSTLTD